VFPQMPATLSGITTLTRVDSSNAGHQQQVFDRYWILTRLISDVGEVLTSQERTRMIEERLLRERIACLNCLEVALAHHS
jgi:hypothetical protein